MLVDLFEHSAWRAGSRCLFTHLVGRGRHRGLEGVNPCEAWGHLATLRLKRSVGILRAGDGSTALLRAWARSGPEDSCAFCTGIAQGPHAFCFPATRTHPNTCIWIELITSVYWRWFDRVKLYFIVHRVYGFMRCFLGNSDVSVDNVLGGGTITSHRTQFLPLACLWLGGDFWSVGRRLQGSAAHSMTEGGRGAFWVSGRDPHPDASDKEAFQK